MAGLMPDPIASLKAQLAAQQGYDWNAGGVDRLSELANWLSQNGITDLSKLGMETKMVTPDAPFAGEYSGNQSAGGIQPDYEAPYLLYDGKPVGGDHLYESSDKGFQFGSSMAGEGNVGFIPKKNPDGTVSIGPVWGSSSDAGKVQDFLKAAAAVGGLAYGASMFAPGAAAAPAASGGDWLAAAAGDAGFDAGSNAIWGGGGDALAAAAGDVGFDSGSNAVFQGGTAGSGLLSKIPKPIGDFLGSKVGASLIGGLLGKTLMPDAPGGGGGGSGGAGVLNPAPAKPAFKMPTWDRTSQGLPGGLGNKSAGLFDQYMRDLLRG